MGQDTYKECWNRVLLRCPQLSPKLSQDFVVNAFRRLAEIRRWSWLVKFSQFISPPVYNTGTVTVTQNSNIIIGSGTTFTAAMVGRQFRTGSTAPIYTISEFVSATEIHLDSNWGAIDASAQAYSIYLCFFTPPDDFHQFICLWDPAFNWQLMLDVEQAEINIWDAQRSNVGNSYVVSFRDYSSSQVGVVANPLQVVGTGPDPIATGTYNAPANSTFTLQVTTGGVSGTAVFKWKKNDGTYTTGVVTDALGTAQALQDGVYIAFPIAQTYVLNDTWVVNCTAISNAGLPRYELWPAQQAAHVYPFLYESRARDLNDENAVLPRYIRGDVLVEMALEDVCLWPGPSVDKPNPYYSLAGARYHQERLRNSSCTGMLDVLEVQDDNVYMQDFSYSYPSMNWPYAIPYGDSAFLQSHAV